MKAKLRYFLAPVALAGLFQVSCYDSSTGVEASPTPVPVRYADADYHLTTLAFSQSDDLTVDITGDGKGDNQFPDAIKEVRLFLSDEIETLAYQYLPSEAAGALMLTVDALLKQFLSVDTLNNSLETQVELEPYLHRVNPPSNGGGAVAGDNLEADFWEGYQDQGETFYWLYTEMGALSGSYDNNNKEVDATGDAINMSIVIAVETYTYEFYYALEMARLQEEYDPEALEQSLLGGAISITVIEQLIDELITYIQVLAPFIPADTIDSLEEDINSLLDDISDIELEDGSRAISATMIFDAEAAAVQEY